MKKTAFQQGDVVTLDMGMVRQEIPAHGGTRWYKDLRRALARGWGALKIWELHGDEAEVVANHPLGMVDGILSVPVRVLRMAGARTASRWPDADLRALYKELDSSRDKGVSGVMMLLSSIWRLDETDWRAVREELLKYPSGARIVHGLESLPRFMEIATGGYDKVRAEMGSDFRRHSPEFDRLVKDWETYERTMERVVEEEMVDYYMARKTARAASVWRDLPWKVVEAVKNSYGHLLREEVVAEFATEGEARRGAAAMAQKQEKEFGWTPAGTKTLGLSDFRVNYEKTAAAKEAAMDREAATSKKAGFESHLDDKMESLGYSQADYEIGGGARSEVRMTKPTADSALRELARKLRPDFNAVVRGGVLVFMPVKQEWTVAAAKELLSAAKELVSARKLKYKGYTIEESGSNYYVTDPSGHRAFGEVPASVETAKKWIDMDVLEKGSK